MEEGVRPGLEIHWVVHLGVPLETEIELLKLAGAGGAPASGMKARAFAAEIVATVASSAC